MLKQFPLQLGEVGAATSLFDILNFEMRRRYCYDLTVSDPFRVNLLFAWQRLCQGQGTCTQSETLVYINLPTETKRW